MTKAEIADDLDEILPTRLAIKAMRDSGYKNTAYALAELIDNAVQANASVVELLCMEEREIVNERERRRIATIGILDNGEGMDAEVLRKALQFGNGTHLKDRSGIGRFGMGLPNASISQCKRVRVWTWQNGRKNALFSYLDLDEIEQTDARKVPAPRHEALPDDWARRSGSIGPSGTLVVWDRFDEHRLTWKTAKTTLEHTEVLVGRIYRKMIGEGRTSVRLRSYDDGAVAIDRLAKVNDPLYLSVNSSTSEPYHDKPMFQPFGSGEQPLKIRLEGVEHVVHVRCSYARLETVPSDGSDRGSKPYGKHAKGNVGVSVVRAGRELELDPAWSDPSDTAERWWGVEVEFPPALDEIFGVTNNKQAARTFASMAKFDGESDRHDGESYTDFRRRMREEGDPREALIEIADYVREQIGLLRTELKNQTKGSRPRDRRHRDAGSVEDQASDKFKERAAKGYTTPQDANKITDENSPAIVDDLVKKGYVQQTAVDIVNAARQFDRDIIYVHAPSEAYAFFSIEPKSALIEIVLNTEHPAYQQLVQVLEIVPEGASEKDLLARIGNASDTLRMLLAAWGRYEMEDVPNRAQIRDVRQEWGKMARDFLTKR